MPKPDEDLGTRQADPKLAAAACRLLVMSRADAADPAKVDRDQLNAAMNWARQALGLPVEFRHEN